MSNFDPPQSQVKRFGVTMESRGEPFEWSHFEEGMEGPLVGQFHARRHFSFDDHLDYTALESELRTLHFLKVRQNQANIEAMTDDSKSSEEVGELLDRYRSEQVEAQRKEWPKLVEQALMLVTKSGHDQLGPWLLKANPKDLRELRLMLEEWVLGRIQEEVEAVANVDPTLPEPQFGASDSPESGPDSDSTE